MRTWTAPINAAANPYQGGWLSETDKAVRLEELRLERADAEAALAEAVESGDAGSADYWRAELVRLTFALEG